MYDYEQAGIKECDLNITNQRVGSLKGLKNYESISISVIKGKIQTFLKTKKLKAKDSKQQREVNKNSIYS